MAFGTHEMVRPGSNELVLAAALGALAQGGRFAFDIAVATDIGPGTKTLTVQIYDVGVGDARESKANTGRLFFSAFLVDPEPSGLAIVSFSPNPQDPSGPTMVDITMPEQEADTAFDGPVIGL